MIVSSIIILIIILTIAVLFLLYNAKMDKSGMRAASSKVAIDSKALADDELQSYLPDQKIAAIKRYRELTGAGLKDAKEAVEAAIADPDRFKSKRLDALHRLSDEAQGAGVRDLIAEGKLEEAARVYAQFMGVDEYTARAAIEDMAEEFQQKSDTY